MDKLSIVNMRNSSLMSNISLLLVLLFVLDRDDLFPDNFPNS